jgi:small conductance mechanosensitive channel
MKSAILLLLVAPTAAEPAEDTTPVMQQKMEDVGADVQDKILEAGSPEQLMQNVWELGREYLVPFAINLLAALAILIIGRWVARLLTGAVRRMMNKANVDETLIKFLANIVYTILMLVVALAAVNRLGVDTTSFAAILAAAGLAVGFALQGSLSNFASGVMLILFKPFKVGDFVDAGGTSGVVEEIQIFNTLLRTGDNVQIIVPNSQITSGKITNFSAKETRRIDLVVGCGYGDNLKEVKEFLETLLAQDERILEDPAPVVAVNELGDNSVNFVVRPWVKASDYWATRWDLTERIKTGFDERGFNIPYPTRDLYVHNVA